jgi:hypothetical protein
MDDKNQSHFGLVIKISIAYVEYGHVQNLNYQFWDMLHLFQLVILALEAKKGGEALITKQPQ